MILSPLGVLVLKELSITTKELGLCSFAAGLLLCKCQQVNWLGIRTLAIVATAITITLILMYRIDRMVKEKS